MSDIKKTPLHDNHIKHGGRMVEFAGWSMPVQFEGIRQEHEAVRKNVGLFDVSHMGEIWVRGENSLETMQWLTSNNVAKLAEGDAQYSLFLNEKGGIVDDIIVYCIRKSEEYMICVNAANRKKDLEWVILNNKGAQIDDEGDHWAQIAIQGPKSPELMATVFGDQTKDIKYFKFKKLKDSFGKEWIVARTGYTGEDGYEVFGPADGASELWESLIKKGENLGVRPIGLGARDSLRTEMKYSLYGHEINDDSNPLEADLGWVVKLKKGDFIGRAPCQKMKKEGPSRKLVGFKMEGKGIPRQGYPLLSFDRVNIGEVTSGTLSPSLSEAIGIGYVDIKAGEVGSKILVEIRGRESEAIVVETPFVKPSTNNTNSRK